MARSPKPRQASTAVRPALDTLRLELKQAQHDADITRRAAEAAKTAAKQARKLYKQARKAAKAARKHAKAVRRDLAAASISTAQKTARRRVAAKAKKRATLPTVADRAKTSPVTELDPSTETPAPAGGQ